MAYAGGYAGGYADTAVLPAPTPGGGFAGPVWTPAHPARPRRLEGRSVLRLKVTVTTWGTEGAQRSRHTMATAVLTHGEGTTRTRTTVSGHIGNRHGHAKATSRTDIRTHVGEPREDDLVVLLAAAFLLSDQHGSTP